jgi:hypothetical protein
MSLYPSSIDSFSTKVDGVDTILASDVNSLQAAVVAVESTLGTMPAGSYATVATALAARLDTAGGTMSGSLDMGGNALTGLATPTGSSDAVPRAYVDGLPVLPTSGQKAALAGSSGSPSASNRYLTESDRQVARLAVRFRDDFIGGRSGAWVLTGTGGTYTQNAEVGGTGTLDTGAASGSSAVLTFGGKGLTSLAKSPSATLILRLATLSQVSAGFGLWYDANNRIDVFYDTSSGSSFKYRCMSGGVSTVVDSGVTADTAYHTFNVQVTGGSSVTFTTDGAASQTITTNLPSSLLEPRVSVSTKESAAKQLVVDLYNLEANR